MSTAFSCPSCSMALSSTDERPGTFIRCPNCRKPVEIPGLEELDEEGLDGEDDYIDDEEVTQGGSNRPFIIGIILSVVAAFIMLVVFKRSVDQETDKLRRMYDANREVVSKVQAAKEAAGQTNWIEAVDLLQSAVNTKDATDLADANRLLGEFKEAKEQQDAEQLERMFDSAVAALDKKDLDNAKKVLEAYRANPHATRKDKANRLVAELSEVTSEEKVAERLRQMSDDDLSLLAQGKPLQNREQFEVGSLSAVFEAILRKGAPQEQARRNEERGRDEAERVARMEQERLASERRLKEAERKRKARENPNLVVWMEQVDNDPDIFFGQYVCFDNVVIGGDHIAKDKERGGFLIGTTSTRGKFYTPVAYDRLFLSTSNTIGEVLQALVNERESLTVKLFCEIRMYKRQNLSGILKIPEANIYKIEVYNRGGKIAMTLK